MKPAPLLVILLPLLFGGCGKKEGPLGYDIQGDTVTITDCDEKASGAITIPSPYQIGEMAFYKCSSLTSVTIPDRRHQHREFGWLPSSGCSSLTSITIPDGVTSIGEMLPSSLAAAA